MVALLLRDVLQERWPPWKAGLYSGHFGKAVSLQGYIFWAGGLAYNTVTLKVHNVKFSFDIWLVLYMHFILYS